MIFANIILALFAAAMLSLICMVLADYYDYYMLAWLFENMAKAFLIVFFLSYIAAAVFVISLFVL